MIGIVAILVGAFVVFIVGAEYGAHVEKAAVSGALFVFTEAKAKLVAAITRARADAATEAARLEALAKRYL